MEQERQPSAADFRWALTIAPLGAAIIFLSVLMNGQASDQAYIIALYAFALAIPVLCLIAFITGLRSRMRIAHWWAKIDLPLLLVGYALIAIGIGAMLHRFGGFLWQAFSVVCLLSLTIAALALPRSQSTAKPRK